MNVLLFYCDVGSPARQLRFLDVGMYHQVLHDARMQVSSILVSQAMTAEELAQQYRSAAARLVVFYIDEFNLAASLRRARELKAAFPDIALCAVGILPVLAPDRITGAGLFDYMIVGEGEFALYELAVQVQARGDVATIKNLWWLDESNWNRNPLRPLLESLDQLPYANRTLFEQDESLVAGEEPVLAVSASRGCMFNCLFCYSPVVKQAYQGKGAYYRVRSAQHVSGEVLAELRRLGGTRVVFVDEQFPVDKEWLRQLAQRLGAAGVRFQATLAVERCDADVLDQLKEAGCDRVALGIETGSEGFRKRMADRNQGNERVLQFAAGLRERGMEMVVTTLAGLPLESEPLLHETYSFTQQLNPAELQSTVFVPIDGTTLRTFALDKGYPELAEEDLFRLPRLELPELSTARQSTHLTRMHFQSILQRMKALNGEQDGVNLLNELPRAKLKMAGLDSIDVGMVRGRAGEFAYLALQPGAECRFGVEMSAETMLRFQLSLTPASLKTMRAADVRVLAEILWAREGETEGLFCHLFRPEESAPARRWRDCMVPAPDGAGSGELIFRVSVLGEGAGAVKVLFAVPRLMDGRLQRRATDLVEMQQQIADKTRELESELTAARAEAAEARREREQKVLRVAELQERILELERLLEQQQAAQAGQDAGLRDKMKGLFRK